MELGPVAEHQRDRVAAAHAELAQPAGERVDAVAQLAPGQRDLVVLRADGDAVGMVRGREPERLGDRAGADGRGAAPCGASMASSPR